MAVRRAGYKLCYVPGFASHHKVQGSHSLARPKYLYSWWRGRLLFQEKCCPIGFRPWTWSCLFMHLILGKWRLDHMSREILADSRFSLRRAVRDHQRSAARCFDEQDMDECEGNSCAAHPNLPVVAGQNA